MPWDIRIGENTNFLTDNIPVWGIDVDRLNGIESLCFYEIKETYLDKENDTHVAEVKEI